MSELDADARLIGEAFRAELAAWQMAELRRVFSLRLRELAAQLVRVSERG